MEFAARIILSINLINSIHSLSLGYGNYILGSMEGYSLL